MNNTEKRLFKKENRPWILLCGCLLSLFIGYIRYITGPELALSLFYLFPIVLVTWYVGFWAGITISVLSALSWLTADLMMHQEFSSPSVPYINETFRCIVFIMITYTVNRLGASLENHKELADTDPLTRLLNRRAFYSVADFELKKAFRYHTPLSFLYMDLDNFKAINDQFGHEIGDKLLHLVAIALKNSVRSIDCIVRFGGDEFGILLSETGAQAAVLVAQKIETRLLKLMSDNRWPVTFSIGVATFERLPDSVDQMINEADTQMYIAKKRGKNRIQYKLIAYDNDFPLALTLPM